MDFKLADKSIAQIVQLVQLGILTGTDISDQLRTMRLSIDKETNTLVPSPEFIESFNENLEKLVEQADRMSKSSTE